MTTSRALNVLCVCAAALALFPTAAQSAGLVRRADPTNYRSVLRHLHAGDTLLLRPGVYLRGLDVHGLNGSAKAPITIAAAASAGTVVFRGTRGRNTISIVDASYVVLRGFVLDGANVPVDGVKCEGTAHWSHHITVEDMVIRGHGADQSLVGISTKCPAWDWVIRDVDIVEAGTGMYLGNSDGTAPFVNGLIERVRIVNPIGYALQIKHQLSRPNLPGMPEGRSHTVIRNSVFIKSTRGSVGELARPNVLLGHFPASGTGSQDEYVVYANLFYDNPTEGLFQAEGHVAVYNNLFINPRGDAVHIQPHHLRPRNVTLFHNTVVAAGTGISVIGGEEGYVRRIEGNAVFADLPFAGETGRSNFSAAYSDAGDYLVDPFGALDSLDMTPKRGRLVEQDAWSDGFDRFPAGMRDYRGVERTVPVFGACDPAVRTPPVVCR